MNCPFELDDDQLSAVRRLQVLFHEIADLIPVAFGLPAGPFPEMPVYEPAGPNADEIARWAKGRDCPWCSGPTTEGKVCLTCLAAQKAAIATTEAGCSPTAPKAEPVQPVRCGDRLAFNPDVSTNSPCVKGTWITVTQIIDLIVDGWSWSDVLRTHPEITEDDILACLNYTVANEQEINP